MSESLEDRVKTLELVVAALCVELAHQAHDEDPLAAAWTRFMAKGREPKDEEQ